VRENRTPGSVRGASGNRRPYRDGSLRTKDTLKPINQKFRRHYEKGASTASKPKGEFILCQLSLWRLCLWSNPLCVCRRAIVFFQLPLPRLSASEWQQ
jgi:hypothetical protein